MKAYEAAKAKGDAGPPPSPDLRLEALADILDGAIKIHSHCYRSDEILMLLRVASRFGVRVQSLQHVLEGYKVAAEIAAHGASASTFSDWWAYKIEAFDAIPCNAGPDDQAGATVVHQERLRGADPPPLPRSRQDGQVRQRARGPGPGHDHDQRRPRTRPRPPARLDRGRQGRRHRDLQRPPLRRLRPLRAGDHRRRGPVPAQDKSTASSSPGPATTPPCPLAAVCAEARAKSLDLAVAPAGLTPSPGPTSTPSPAPTSPTDDRRDRRRQDRRRWATPRRRSPTGPR